MSCGKNDSESDNSSSGSETTTTTGGGDNTTTNCSADTSTTALTTVELAVLTTKFGTKITLSCLANYAGQTVPAYITKSTGTAVTNAKATLGRVLFYDRQLSIDNTVSCADCHQQALAFSDPDISSDGVAGGKTGRHSMRLINARFAEEVKFFWNERAASLEAQTTQPIQDHNEMGFSGTGTRGTLTGNLIPKLSALDYYQALFKFVYGDSTITEARMQEALSHFIRSIQSFDSKFDTGRAVARDNAVNFANFTADENAGKTLFIERPTFDTSGTRTTGGAGCGGCHRAPEFDIDDKSLNNGVTGNLGGGTDTTVTRAPTLRDIVTTTGALNGPLMHTGGFTTLESVVEHYNSGIANVTNLDGRLLPNRNPQRLNLTTQEKAQLVAFLKTLSGTNVYTDTKWSSPFL